MTSKMQYFSKNGMGYDTPQEALDADDRLIATELIRAVHTWANQLQERLYNSQPLISAEDAVGRVKNIWQDCLKGRRSLADFAPPEANSAPAKPEDDEPPADEVVDVPSGAQ